jgi:putative peptide zinc metalloprotease protein
MAKAFFSSYWHRVADLQPRLRSHARIVRHQYRGETWYVLDDPSTQRFHRFTPDAHLPIGLMDGRRTVQEIWEITCERLGDNAPTQDEMIQLLGQLYAADVLECDVPADVSELLARHERQRRKKWQQQAASVFAWRFPLIDPERFLQATLPVVRPLFGWTGALLWLAVVVPAIALAVVNWTDLSNDFIGRALTPQNAFAIWLIFPLVKVVHEFGHAYAVKAFGGEVHDMGVMLLVLTPVPYVDASSASAMRSKWHRVLVGAAGMLVEVFVAALAAYVWVAAEPGVLRTVAYNTIAIAGISTVLFNANPLLRFDGYHILVDALEIPNLRQRATAYMRYLCERYAFGRRDADEPVSTPGERSWFVGFTLASFVYRVVITVGILIFIGDRYFWLGVLLAAAAAVAWVAVPVGKGVHFLFTSPRIRTVRARAMTATGAAALVVLVAVSIPVPYRTMAEGVVWLPEESYVRPETEGFVEQVVAMPGARVRTGDALLVLRNSDVTTGVTVLAAQRREVEARYAQQRPVDPVRAAIVLQDLRYVERDLARARERTEELTVRARTDGTFVLPNPENIAGRFAGRGELLAFVVDLDTVTVRAVVSQATIDLVRQRTAAVDVRLAERLDQPVPASVRRVVPAASDLLPSTALGSQGGGNIAVDPRDQGGAKAVQTVFQVELGLPSFSGRVSAGGRAYVRFDHGRAPLAVQWYEDVRRLFLSRFNA